MLSFSSAQFGLGADAQEVIAANANAQAALQEAEAAVAVGNQNTSAIQQLQENGTGSGGSGGGSGGGQTIITLAATTTNPNQVLDSLATTSFRTVKYLVQVTAQTTGGVAYSAVEILILQDGTNGYLTQYGEIDSGQGDLSTYDVSIVSGNMNLLVTPLNATTTYKASRITIPE